MARCGNHGLTAEEHVRFGERKRGYSMVPQRSWPSTFRNVGLCEGESPAGNENDPLIRPTRGACRQLGTSGLRYVLADDGEVTGLKLENIGAT